MRSANVMGLVALFVGSGALAKPGTSKTDAKAEAAARVGQVIAGGDASSIERARFTPSGQRIVTLSKDRTVLVWEAGSGKRLHAWPVKAGSGAVLSPDGRLVAILGTGKVWSLESGKLVASLAFDADCGGAFSGDGGRLLVLTLESEESVRRDHCDGAEVWDVKGQSRVAETQVEAQAAIVSPDGKRAILIADGAVGLWDVQSARKPEELDISPSGENTAFSPDGASILHADGSTLHLIDPATRKDRLSWPHSPGTNAYVRTVAFSPDGKSILSVELTPKTWLASTGKPVASFSGHRGSVWSGAFAPSGKRVVTAGQDKIARVWDAESGALVASVEQASPLRDVGFSPDGKQLVTVTQDGEARLWDAESGRPVRAVSEPHKGPVNSVVFSPDGKRLLSSSEKGAKVWDVDGGRLILSLAGEPGYDGRGVFSPDGKHIATSGADNSVRLWDADTGALLATLTGHVERVTGLVFSPDGQRLLTATAWKHSVISRDATARLWDVASGKLVAALAGHESEVRCARFGPDGRFIVTCSADFTARIWDAKSLKTLFVLQPKQLVDDAAFTPDGARLVTVGSSQAHVWDTKDAKLLATLEAPRTGSLKRVVLSPDGGRALIVGYSNRANVWDLASGTVAYFIEQKTEVRVARFSPDGKYLVTGSQDNTGTIWDAATGARLVTLKGHSESVLDAAFSPDSTRVATAGYDGTIRTWRAPPYTK